MKKLVAAKEKLARLEDGGSPERPIELSSASQVEVHARSLACLRCGTGYRVEEHAAVEGLRLARVVCPQCGARREVWFRLAKLN
jgi:DNA-directed RNA polymerase subunit RPC12/RpoP